MDETLVTLEYYFLTEADRSANVQNGVGRNVAVAHQDHEHQQPGHGDVSSEFILISAAVAAAKGPRSI